MSAGIRSGVNWMRLKLEVEDAGERLDEQRLGQPGHAGEQAVAAGEERDQHLIDDLVLPDDDLAQLVEDPLAPRRDPLRQIFAVCFRRPVHRVPSLSSRAPSPESLSRVSASACRRSR